MKIAFMGTPDFAATILQALAAAGHEISMVVTQPDKARDRGKKVQHTPVKEVALTLGLPVFQPERVRGNAAFLQQLQDDAPDVAVVAAYGQILPMSILTTPKFGCVNVHASLLPKLRGASPIQHAIINGEQTTGVTIMQMAEGLDTGDILTQVEVPIGRMNGAQLHDALAEAGAKLLVETLPKLAAGEICPVPQEEALSTYAGLIKKQDGRIDFHRSATEIERLIRGFDPWPGAFCEMDGMTVKLWAAEVTGEPAPVDVADGQVIAADKAGLRISCGGQILLITQLQAPGKKRMAAADYLRGHAILPGTLLK